jgi:hypothetical protein
MDEVKKAQRFLAVCLLGALLFNYPFLALFNRAGLFLGIPIFYAYLFGVWAALIALMAYVVGCKDEPGHQGR